LLSINIKYSFKFIIKGVLGFWGFGVMGATFALISYTPPTTQVLRLLLQSQYKGLSMW